MRISAVSDPPPSLTTWTVRSRLVRVALNVEQLLYRSPGGIGRYTAQLANLPDVDVVPFAARHRRATLDAALEAAGVRSRRVLIQPLPRPLLYEAWHRWDRPALRVGDVDVVHAPSVAVPPRGRAPLVVTVHDAAAELFPEAFPARGLRFHRQGLAAAAARADLVITVSHAAAAEITERTPIPAERVRVVPNGVDAPALDPAAAEAARARLGLAGRPYVLWVGSLEPRKGVGTLVAAMAALARRRGGNVPAPRPLLVLAGYPGWLSDAVVDAADRAALGDDLVQVGRVAEADLWALYAGAELLAFPSVHEGFGLPPVEAMAVGTPVIASDLPVLREVGGPAARYVPAGDTDAWAEAIAGLLADPPAGGPAAAAGRERAARFSVAAHQEGTLAVYREAAGGPATR
jgi:glycosyltransferase involved in cell wall biosynthesis